MSELREAILNELSFKDEADVDIADAILDAVIASLPDPLQTEPLKSKMFGSFPVVQILPDKKEDRIYKAGFNSSLENIKTLLESAKESN